MIPEEDVATDGDDQRPSRVEALQWAADLGTQNGYELIALAKYIRNEEN